MGVSVSRGVKMCLAPDRWQMNEDGRPTLERVHDTRGRQPDILGSGTYDDGGDPG